MPRHSRKGRAGPEEVQAADLAAYLRQGSHRSRARGLPRPTKHGNARTPARLGVMGWMWFDSRREARHYEEILFPSLAAGELRLVLPQVPFRLPGGVRYRADFVTWGADGALEVLDVKGHRTAGYIAKRKLVESLYKIDVREV